jgi:hypothetical protein
VVGTAISTRAKWRSSPSALIGMLKICLTPPTLSERRYYVSHDRFQFFELTTSIERILLEVRRKWAKLYLSQSVLGMVDRNLPSI